MANNPTIVAASLSDEALKTSIKNLVSEVDTAVNNMAKNFNEKVGSMEQAIKNFANMKFDSGSSSGNGIKKSVDDQKNLEEQTKKTTQAVKEQGYTYDQLAEYMKNAATQAEKRFAVTDIQQLRMRQHEIVAELGKLEGTKLSGAIREFNELKEKSEEVKRRIAELQSLMSQFRTNEQKSAARQEIENLRTQLMLLNGEMSRIQPTGNAEQRINSLRLEYEQINRRISQMGQELIDAEQKELGLANASRQETNELDKQLQKIKELNSAKEAKAMFVDIAAMPIDTLEQAREKIEAIRALMQKVENTPLMGKADFEKLRNQFYATNEAIRQFGLKASESAEKENSAAKQTVKSEKERQEEIQKTGQAAQDTAKKIISSLHSQASDAKNTNPLGIISDEVGRSVNQINQLKESIEQMSRAYWEMSSAERESPVGIALKHDIKIARDAIAVVDDYNRRLLMGATDNNSKIISNESTLKGLRTTLSQLTAQYENLKVAEINAGKGDQIIQHYQDVNRAAQILQRTLNRPINLQAALAGDERTLDDIAYKMQRLQAYRQGIDLTKPGAENEIKQVDDKLKELQRDADKWISKSKEIENRNNALGRSWNYMKNRLAFYFTVGASTAFIKNLIEIRSQYEMNERALGILINSAERGTQIFKELSDMALVSPYTLIELSNAAKQLTAYDIAAKNVVDTTRRLADMASAVGVPMERLTYALGQIKAYGYLNSRDARMFANAGIPLVRELSKYYTELEGKIVSVGDVYDRMKKKSIDYNDVMAVVTKMTDEGGKFFDFQAKMADTLKVRLANLTLAWNNMLNEIGASEQGVLTTGIGMLKDFFLHWKDIEEIIRKVVYAFGLFKAAQMITLAFMGELNTAMGMQVLLGTKLQTKLAALTSSTKALSVGLSAFGMAFWAILADAYVTYSRNAEEIERLNKTIADGAKEASEALDKMLHSSEMVSSRMSAMQGKLSATDAAKTWEALREQIELSAISSKSVVAEIVEEIQKNGFDRGIEKAFGFAESIQKVTSKLSDLNDKLQITQDEMLGGLFGEGVVEDIEDYNERLKYEAELAEWAANKNSGFWENAVMGLKGLFHSVKEDLGSSKEEAEKEIKKFAEDAAQVIKDELGEEGLKDKIQVNEAIARVLQGFEQMYPQIRGKGKVLFETLFNETMAKEFEGSVDKQAYYYEKFLEQLKKDHGSAFNEVTDEILKDTHKWSSSQLDAIQKTADKVRKDLPEASQDAIDKILRQLNSTEFKVRIVAEMATTSVDEVQRQFNEKFIKKPGIEDQKEREKAEAEAAQKYGTLRRKSTESNVEYEKRISDERNKQFELSQKNADIISANKSKQDEYSKAVVKDAENAKAAADAWLKAADEVEKAGGYDFSTKSERSAASKAQKAAESELQKALKEEIKLIDEATNMYKKMTDSGINRTTALTYITNKFGDSIEHINSVLGKNNIPKFDIRRFAGTDDPHKLLQMLEEQRAAAKLSRNVKPEEISELQIKYDKVDVDAKVFDATKITKGLNNELGHLKDEYELAVELDANPEFGNMFAEMFDLDLDTMPKTAKEYADAYTKQLNKYFQDQKTDIRLPNLLNVTKDDMEEFRKQMEEGKLEMVYYDLIKEAYKETQAARKKETTDTINEWNKLVEKYGEFEAKITKINNDAEKERKIATLMNAPKSLFEAIDLKQRQLTAKAAFERFQGSSEWIVATGDLTGMTKEAIGSLIDSIEEYKKKAKYLDPKQIKQINNALKALHKEQRKNNPFKSLSNAMDEAKDKAEVFQEEIDSEQEKLNKLSSEMIQSGQVTEETTGKIGTIIERIKELKKAQEEVLEVDINTIIEGLKSVMSTVKQATGLFTDMFGAIGGDEVKKDIEDMFSVVDNTLKGLEIGAAIGGKWGAVIGGIVGMLTSVVSKIGDIISGNEGINSSIEVSERRVRGLELAYVDLQRAVDDAYGSAVIGAKKATVYNKELQLAELKRQLALEQSRKSKNIDQDRIVELRKQIRELEYDIIDSIKEITNSMLGISSVGDAAEALVSNMIESFRKGEDYMLSLKDSYDDMIDNMIMKSIVANVIGKKIDELFAKVSEAASQRASAEEARYEEAVKKYSDAMSRITNPDWWEYYSFDPYGENVERQEQSKISFEEWQDLWEKRIEYLRKQYEEAATPTPDDVKAIEEMRDGWYGGIKEEFEAWMNAFGIKYGQDATNQLSALQQGISGITETQAGALEAYWNANTQQQYVHSDLLTQIRDAVQSFDMDLQLGVFSQMLLQLQTNYTVMMSMHSMMEGWTVASGQGIRVELIS
jgi:hypothetical protein